MHTSDYLPKKIIAKMGLRVERIFFGPQVSLSVGPKLFLGSSEFIGGPKFFPGLN
jgi:hypothetical protein